MNYTYDNKELFINIHQNDEYKEVINIEILDGINTYTSLCNINEIEYINLFENDINILIDELKELFINNSFEISYNNNCYTIIFFYTLSKKRKINISFNCTLIENENTVNNTIVYLNNKISKMDYQIKQLTNKLNLYEPLLQFTLVGNVSHIYNNKFIPIDYSFIRTTLCHTTDRKIKITFNVGNITFTGYELSFLQAFVYDRKDQYITNNCIDTTNKILSDYIKTTYINMHIRPLKLLFFEQGDLLLFFDKTKLIFDHNNIKYEYYFNDTKHINIPLSEQLIADSKEQKDNIDKYYYENINNNLYYVIHVPYATNDYYLLTNVGDSGYQYKLNREICDDLQVNFNAISHLYSVTYIK